VTSRVAIHSVPRSGSTWLGSIFDSHPNVIYRYQPLFSFAFKDYLTPESSRDDILEFFKRISVSNDEFITQANDKRRGLVPSFEKNIPETIVYKEVRYHHLLNSMLKSDNELKIIGLVRNPLANVHSWLNAPKEFKVELNWKVEDEWRLAARKNLGKPEEFNGFEKWKEVAFLFERLSAEFPDRFKLVSYSSLLTNTESTINRLFNFVGLSMNEQTKRFLELSRSRQGSDAYDVYRLKEKDDHWKNILPEYIVNYIMNDIQATPLEKYLN